MKNPRLSEIARQYLEAVEELLEYYRVGYKIEPFDHAPPANKFMPMCPFCVVDESWLEWFPCGACPWVVLNNTICVEHREDICNLRYHPTPQWRTGSIKRLTRWARLIKDGTYDKKLRKEGLI